MLWLGSVGALAAGLLAGRRGFQESQDVWQLYHLLHYCQQCGGREVQVTRPQRVSFQVAVHCSARSSHRTGTSCNSRSSHSWNQRGSKVNYTCAPISTGHADMYHSLQVGYWPVHVCLPSEGVALFALSIDYRSSEE